MKGLVARGLEKWYIRDSCSYVSKENSILFFRLEIVANSKNDCVHKV